MTVFCLLYEKMLNGDSQIQLFALCLLFCFYLRSHKMEVILVLEILILQPDSQLIHKHV